MRKLPVSREVLGLLSRRQSVETVFGNLKYSLTAGNTLARSVYSINLILKFSLCIKGIDALLVVLVLSKSCETYGLPNIQIKLMILCWMLMNPNKESILPR